MTSGEMTAQVELPESDRACRNLVDGYLPRLPDLLGTLELVCDEGFGAGAGEGPTVGAGSVALDIPLVA